MNPMNDALFSRIAHHTEMVDALKEIEKLRKQNKALTKKLNASNKKLGRKQCKNKKLRDRRNDCEDQIAQYKTDSAKQAEMIDAQKSSIKGLSAEINNLNLTVNKLEQSNTCLMYENEMFRKKEEKRERNRYEHFSNKRGTK